VPQLRFATVVIATVTVAAALVAAAGSSAHTESFDSTVTIRHEDGTAKYSGRVISDRDACKRNRTIRLHTAKGDVIAETTTNGKGRWRYEFIGQRYYATVTKRVDGSGQHQHVCRADRSPTTPE